MTARDTSRCGSLGLAGQLDGLLEALQGEHDAGRQGGEHPVRAVRQEPAGGGEVAEVEAGQHQHRDGQQRDRRLPDHHGAVGLGHRLDPDEVDDREEQHEAGRDQQPGRGQRAVHPQDRHVLVDPRDAVDVRQRRLDLDGRDGDGLQPGHPAGREAGQRPEHEPREPGRAAGGGVRRAELGVDEREDRQHDRREDPRHQ